MPERAVILKAFSFAIREYVRRGEFKTEGAFNRHLWDAALSFFRDEINAFEFIDVFVVNIEEQLRKAWNEGARSVEVMPEDMTAADMEHLQGIINNEFNYVLGLAEDIENAKLNGWTLDQFRAAFRSRIDIWSNRYLDVVNEARIWFGGKSRLKWQLGATEQHCATCAQLNGIVAWAEEWDQSGVRPGRANSPFLECRGYRCACTLNPTTQRRSPRALNSILGIIMPL